jgi:ribosome-associated protein
MIKPLELARKARRILEEKKGEDIVLLDVRKLSGITDYYLIVSGASSPHLRAMFDEVLDLLKEEGMPCYRRSGEAESGWLVLDYVDVIIHILATEKREYYAIEELWAKAPRLR